LSLVKISRSSALFPQGKPLRQDNGITKELDEWVILLQGEDQLSYADDTRLKLKAGDYLLIPAHTKHRVEHTSIEPPCIWLAVHGQFAS